ncbi:hypothetical protein D3C80_953310 [compost metagenome]
MIARQSVTRQQIQLTAVRRQHQLLYRALQRAFAELRRLLAAKTAKHQTPVFGNPGQQILPVPRFGQCQQCQGPPLFIQRQWSLP